MLLLICLDVPQRKIVLGQRRGVMIPLQSGQKIWYQCNTEGKTPNQIVAFPCAPQSFLIEISLVYSSAQVLHHGLLKGNPPKWILPSHTKWVPYPKCIAGLKLWVWKPLLNLEVLFRLHPPAAGEIFLQTVGYSNTACLPGNCLYLSFQVQPALPQSSLYLIHTIYIPEHS